MHTSYYKFIKNKNKCDVTIKSIITKAPLVEKKMIETIKESTKIEKKLGREKEY